MTRARDAWHVTIDMWHMVGGKNSLKNLANQALTVGDWQCLEDSEQKDDLKNE